MNKVLTPYVPQTAMKNKNSTTSHKAGLSKNSKFECRNPKQFRISCFEFRIYSKVGLRASSALFRVAILALVAAIGLGASIDAYCQGGAGGGGGKGGGGKGPGGGQGGGGKQGQQNSQQRLADMLDKVQQTSAEQWEQEKQKILQNMQNGMQKRGVLDDSAIKQVIEGSGKILDQVHAMKPEDYAAQKEQVMQQMRQVMMKAMGGRGPGGMGQGDQSKHANQKKATTEKNTDSPLDVLPEVE